jgi:ribosomal protein L37AE/L43A
MNHNPKCPICGNPQSTKETDNLKVCPKCAEQLQWSITPEIELVSQYSHN